MGSCLKKKKKKQKHSQYKDEMLNPTLNKYIKIQRFKTNLLKEYLVP
jgi:hypothetical protein